MRLRSTWFFLATIGATCVVLFTVGSTQGLAAQIRQPRQSDFTPQQLEALRDAIQSRNNRVTIGFKPAGSTVGLREDGTPALSTPEVRDLAVGLDSLGVQVLRQFRHIPAVAALIDPALLETLLADPTIDYVAPEVLYEPTGYSHGSEVQEVPWGIVRVAAAAAWSATRGGGARLGIIDSGIDEDHPDINAVGGINLVTGGTTRADWNDNSTICTFTHGTHVAGTAAALDNDDGVVGVAPEAELYALRVFDPENAGFTRCVASDFDIVAALEYAIDNNFDVVNMSLGSSVPSIPMGDAVAAASIAGVIVVSSAGNTGASVGFPAAFPQSLAVAAINETDGVAGFSSHGPEVDIAAPGVGVLSTIGGGTVGLANGTSMASPHVAGVATLLRSARPDLTAEQVRSILRNTSEDIFTPGYDEFTGSGVVRADVAVAAVAGGVATLAVVPSNLEMTAAAGGPTTTVDVIVSNLGDNSSIDWTTLPSAPWLSATPAVGSVTAGGVAVAITADPTGLETGIHTATLTFDGQPQSLPFELRVRLAVATAVTLDPMVSLNEELDFGERKRFALVGSSGQLVDIAVLTDHNHFAPLNDPVLRVFAPDGQTVLGFNDDAPIAGLGTQSLVYGIELPADGTYLIEVGSFGDFSRGGFVLKARESGPILGLETRSALLRVEDGGQPAEIVLELLNLTGVGTAGFTATSLVPWLSIDPLSGSAATDFVALEHAVDSSKLPSEKLQLFGVQDYRDPSWVFSRSRSGSTSPTMGRQTPDAVPLATSVVVSADPTGLPLGPHFGEVVFESTDEWLANTISFTAVLQVFSPGMQVISSDHNSVFGVGTDSPSRGGAVATTGDENGTLFSISVDGAIGERITTELNGFPGGVTTGTDGNWYVGSNRVNDPFIRRVTPAGDVSILGELPDNVLWVTAGPEDDVYGSATFLDQIFRVSLEDGLVQPFSFVPFPVGLSYDIINKQFLTASFNGGVYRTAPDGTFLGVIASNVAEPLSIAVGASGTTYIGDIDGVIWIVTSSNSSATIFAAAPGGGLFGLALVDGALVMSSRDQGEFYRFPVEDGPAIIPPRNITVRLVTDEVDAMTGKRFEVPLVVDLSGSDGSVATYTATLEWTPEQLDITDVERGDFTTSEGSFVTNTKEHASGRLQAAAIEAEGRSGAAFTMFSMDAYVKKGVAGGSVVPIQISITELGGPLGEDFLPNLRIESGQVCVGVHPFGDVTQNRTISGSDAVQVLRHLVALPLAPGSDIKFGDVDGDGRVGVEDAIQILRFLVDLPVPSSSRVNQFTVGPCD